MPAARHTLRNVLLTLIAAVAVSLTLWMTLPPEAPAPAVGVPPPPPAGSLPVVAGLGGDFRLPSTRGGDLALQELRGKVVLLNFGFTHCPDVCPLVLTRMAAALRELERQGTDLSRVQPLFVTFDPERDTLDHLREYAAFFHPALVALRGDAEQTAAVTRQYKVLHLKQDTGSASGYVFQHSDFVYVIDPAGRVRLLVGSRDPEAALVEAVKRLLRDADREPRAAAPAPALTVSGGWARAMPPNVRTTAGYLEIANNGVRDDLLLGARIEGVRVAEVHEMVRDGDGMVMRHREEIAVPAGGRLSLAPGGLHLMLIEAAQPLQAGGVLQGVLRFRDAGEVPVRLDVRAP
ncbi:MAG: SCO family protein [Pseudomonadota bacterium]